MDLKSLKLNRFLYRDNGDVQKSDVVSSLFSTTQNNQGGGSGYENSPSTPQIPANGVASNSTIQSSKIQSSPSSYRMEIDPVDNTIKGYDNHNRLVILISPTFGIQVGTDKQKSIFLFTDGNMEVVTLTVEELIHIIGNFVLDGQFIYKGIIQPVNYMGSVVGATGALTQINMSGWSAVRNAVGDYTITHNLGNDFYTLFFTPINVAPVFWTVVGISTTDFEVLFYDIAGAPVDPTGFQFELHDVT